jgi:hypothetical protein
MTTLRNEADRKGLVARLAQLRPESRARWGNLDAPRMMCHLRDALDSALGTLPVPPMGPPILRHFPMKHLALYVIPMPKGAKSPPEMLRTPPGDFEDDRARVLERMEQIATAPSGPGPEHFIFGPLTIDQWNALNWKHIDHHLRQFGN